MNKTLVSQLRREKNWTQEELAEKSYVTVRTIQRLEAGDDVNIDTLRSVSNALSVSINDLFESIDDEENELKIIEISKQQSLELKKRNEEYGIYKLLLIAVGFLSMGFFGLFISKCNDNLQAILGIIWLFIFLIGIAFSRYFLKIYLLKKLDRKYPLTIGISNNNLQNKQKAPDNVWSFLSNYWWIIFPIGGFLSSIISSIK